MDSIGTPIRVCEHASGDFVLGEMKQSLADKLQEMGVLQSLKLQLRTTLIQEFQAKLVPAAGGKGRGNLPGQRRRPHTLGQKVVNGLIMDYFESSEQFPFSLSIFASEAGASGCIDGQLSRNDMLKLMRIADDGCTASKALHGMATVDENTNNKENPPSTRR